MFRLVGRRYFEAPTVILGAKFSRLFHGFLARHPTVPRGRASGAVSEGAGETEKLPDHLLLLRVVDYGRCAAE